jgi:hypothetical protein
MIRLEKSSKRFFLDYDNVETHLAYMRKKNKGLPVGQNPVKTLMVTNPPNF